jgi:predicted transcriptional regulator of viral defense system
MKIENLIEQFGERPLFELREVLALSTDSAKSLKNQLSGWTRDGKLTRLRRGIYLLEEPYRKQMPSVYYISNCLLRPSYVSLQTALQFHGMIPEAVGVVQAVTPKHGREWETAVGTFDFRSIKQERFWGYREYATGRPNRPQQTFLMARPEKCLLDVFYRKKGQWEAPRLRQMRFQNLDRLDPERLESYAERFDSPKVSAATGRLLSEYQDQMT